jgi:hypothetical protein
MADTDGGEYGDEPLPSSGGVSGAVPGTSKSRTGGSKPLGAGQNLVPITAAMRLLFLQEELDRYARPTTFFVYTTNDGRRVRMAPLKCAPPTAPLKLTGLISRCTNPVSIVSVPIQSVH